MALLVTALLLSGCAKESAPESFVTGPNATTANPIVTKVGGATITQAPGTRNVHYDKINGILSFSSQTKLPDGTLLQTQLSREGKPETWWPTDRLIKIKDGVWQISVRLGESGAPSSLSNEETYRLDVWQKDNPSQKEEPLYLDMTPPPAPKP